MCNLFLLLYIKEENDYVVFISITYYYFLIIAAMSIKIVKQSEVYISLKG